MFLRILSTVLALLGGFGLVGCGHTPFTQTVVDAARADKGVDSIRLNPALQYLRVSTSKRAVLMVLGYTETVPDGVVQTWYSAEGEVIRLLNGRLFSSAGLQTDWRNVTYAGVPAWQDMRTRSSAQYQRMRDEMPGYRFGIRETLLLLGVEPAANSRLQGISPSKLNWYEETVKGSSHGLASARYAVDYSGTAPAVVYGEQCPTRAPSYDECISWQTWPAVP